MENVLSPLQALSAAGTMSSAPPPLGRVLEVRPYTQPCVWCWGHKDDPGVVCILKRLGLGGEMEAQG